MSIIKMRLPQLLWLTVRGIVTQRTVIQFNKKLYQQLLEKCEISGKTLDEPVTDMDIEFTAGPIDGELGSFDPDNKKMTVDALEICLVVMKRGICSQQEFIEAYDKELTRVLAHEGGHFFLDKRLGPLAILEKLLILLILGLVGVGFLGFCLILGIGMFNIVMMLIASYSYPLAVVIGVLTCVPVLTIFVRAFLRLRDLWFVLAMAITYRICYHERFARQFEQNTGVNPEWVKVIEIEII